MTRAPLRVRNVFVHPDDTVPCPGLTDPDHKTCASGAAHPKPGARLMVFSDYRDCLCGQGECAPCRDAGCIGGSTCASVCEAGATCHTLPEDCCVPVRAKVPATPAEKRAWLAANPDAKVIR